MDPNQQNQTPAQPTTVQQSTQTQPTQPQAAPQPVAQAPSPAPVQNQTPQPATAPVAQTPPNPAPAKAPTVATPPPPPPRRKFPIKLVIIIAIVFILIFAGIVVVALMSGGPGDTPVNNEDVVFAPSSTPVAGPRDHVAEEYPNFSGIEIDENTVAFNKVDESFRIKYLGKIYHEQDTGKFQPREVTPQTAEDFPWYGLVDTPEDVVGDPQLFSFKAPPTYRSFVFIMKWDRADGEKYEMFRFANDQVIKLAEFTKDRFFYVPVIDDFSLGGNFMSINIFRCPTCFEEDPEVLLYHIPSGETRNIGRVSYFEWGDDDTSYEYREYIEGVNENDIPLSKNDFFVDSEVIFNSSR